MEMNIEKVLQENEALKAELHKKEKKEQYLKSLIELMFEDVKVMKSNNKLFIRKLLSVIEDFENSDSDLESDLNDKIFNLYKNNVNENADKSAFKVFETEDIEDEEMQALVTSIGDMIKGLDDEDTVVISV